MALRTSHGRATAAAFLNRTGRPSPAARMPGMARKTSSMNFCAAKDGSRVGDDTCAPNRITSASLPHSFD